VEISIATGLAAAALLLLLKILLTAGYGALVNVRKNLLKERLESGRKGAGRALSVAEDATRLLVTYQFLAIVLNSVIALLFAVTLSPPIKNALEENGVSSGLASGLAYGLLLLVVSVLLLVVGERLPTLVAMGRPEPAAIVAAWPMKWIVRLLAPLILLVLRLSGRTVKLLGVTSIDHLVTEEEIKTLVDAGSEEGVLEDEEKEMIYSIIRFFDDTLAREVMVPRIDIVGLDIESSLEEALDIIIKAGHSRIPVYRDTIDNIVGSLYAKDLLKVWREGVKPETLEPLLREPYFVPESKKASDLLVELQERKTHLVYVVDEYGGTAGIVTLEDLVEEIVGEIQDEYDIHEEALYEYVTDNEYIFNARIDIDNVNHLLEVSLPTEESDTLGGYIFAELGRVPSVGDEITKDNLVIRVLSVTGRRIRKVHVKKIVQPPPEDQPAATTQDAEPLNTPAPDLKNP
jgi:CBS domain containing-hemolysin-like protein